MLAAGTVLRAARMPLLYVNFVAAYRNRARSYTDMPGHVEYRLRNGLRLLAAPGPHDLRIINEIWLDGEYAAAGFIPEGSWNIVDLGANKGYFASWALMTAPAARVHCYEPDPRNVAALRRNVAPFTSSASIHEMAVGSSSGSLTLFRLAGRSGQASVYQSRAASRGRIIAELAVPVVALRDVVTRAGPVDLLKVDVEGAEYNVLLDSPPAALEDVRRIAIEADPTDPCQPHRGVADLLGHLAATGFTELARTRSVIFLARESARS